MKAPMTPMMMSPMMPRPVPWTILPASQPATRPTIRTTIRLLVPSMIPPRAAPLRRARIVRDDHAPRKSRPTNDGTACRARDSRVTLGFTSSALDEPDDDQQDHGADEGVDDRVDEPRADDREMNHSAVRSRR